MMKINVNTAGLMMDCMSFAYVASVTKERGTAPSDKEIHNAVKSLMTLYCRHEGISAPIDEVPSEYTGIPTCPYLSLDEEEEEDSWDDEEEEEEDEEEDEDWEEEDESDRIANFSSALDELMEEYGLASETDYKYNEFIDNLYHYKD